MSENPVTELRIANLEGAVGEIKQAVRSIDSSLQTLARLEVHHTDTRDSLGRAFADIEDHESRLRLLEKDAPTMRLVRGWVVACIIGTVSIVGVAVLNFVVSGGIAPSAPAAAGDMKQRVEKPGTL